MIFCIPRRRCFSAFLVLVPALSIVIRAQELSDAQIDVVSQRLAESAQKSWELGTRAQTILERNAITYSVFSGQPLPPPSAIPKSQNQTSLEPFFDIAYYITSSRPKNQSPQPLMQDGSAADPASNGVCILITNWTRAGGGRFGGLDYAAAAKAQVDYLFTAVPRTSDGALSHRVSEIQLWSDFVYMVPPFLAYYGVTTRNRTILREAYNQISLYRKYLRDPATGMWKHVLLGPAQNDPGFWATGNGWAAAGMLRVWATIRYSEYAPTLKYELDDLATWVREIHAGVYSYLDDTGILANYIDKSVTSSGNFYDAASTALLASTVYRAAKLLGQNDYLSHAERSRTAISTTFGLSWSSSLFSSNAHFTQDGVLFPVVDPYRYGQRATGVSPEAQAFVVQMHQAWKDWKGVGDGAGRGSSGAARVFGIGKVRYRLVVVLSAVAIAGAIV